IVARGLVGQLGAAHGAADLARNAADLTGESYK
ncbi:hypothetical protein A2U01_0113291, partial [Trifolium medium]|nr:hypothetical protein [Trifolium medium]